MDVRADRLLAILLLLQRGSRVTAADLARRLEVSERTIYRDVEALGAAGVPVYAQPGRNGGIRLVDGYRTDLTGLTANEAELVPLLGLADVLGGAGVGAFVRRAEEKVLTALPAGQRERAERSRRRIYVDLARWWESPEPVPHLATLVEAVLGGRRVRLRYRRGDGATVRRTVDTHGLVVQGGVWYLVARTRERRTSGGDGLRIYRVSRVAAVTVLDASRGTVDDVDLAAFWARRKEEFHESRTGYRATVSATARGLRALQGDGAREAPASIDRDTGRATVEVAFHTRAHAFGSLLGLGPDVVVVEPDDLRAAIADAARATAALYEG